MIKGETKFWHEIKAFNIKNNCELSFTRVENTASWGTPDILGYNRNSHFFTVELKVASGNKARLSPHQVSFHARHPKNSFGLVEWKKKCLLFEGHQSLALVDSSLSSLEPVASSLEDSVSFLSSLGA